MNLRWACMALLLGSCSARSLGHDDIPPLVGRWRDLPATSRAAQTLDFTSSSAYTLATSFYGDAITSLEDPANPDGYAFWGTFSTTDGELSVKGQNGLDAASSGDTYETIVDYEVDGDVLGEEVYRPVAATGLVGTWQASSRGRGWVNGKQIGDVTKTSTITIAPDHTLVRTDVQADRTLGALMDEGSTEHYSATWQQAGSDVAVTWDILQSDKDVSPSYVLELKPTYRFLDSGKLASQVFHRVDE